jgi:Zn-dependent oligopeptidase
VNEDDTKIEFTREELEGLSDDFLSGLKKTTVDGVEKYIVTMKYPDLIPVLKMAKKEETRKALDIANSTRCKENIAMLEEAVELRRECAKVILWET